MSSIDDENDTDEMQSLIIRLTIAKYLNASSVANNASQPTLFSEISLPLINVDWFKEINSGATSEIQLDKSFEIIL